MVIQALLTAILLSFGCAAAHQDGGDADKTDIAGGAVQDGSGAVEVATPFPADVDPRIDALLTTLEQAHKELLAFEAKVTYEKVDDLLGRREIQQGDVLVTREPETDDMRFAVLFDVHMVGSLGGNLRREEKLNHYIFDGRWLAEIDHDRKQFIKRELVPPGRKLNPLKLGEGPIPLPVGQAREEVLRRFKVTEATLPSEGPLKQLDAAQLDGLHLVPRTGAPEAGEYEHVDIFYDKSTRLPVGIRAVLTSGDVKTVLLMKAVANPEWDDDTRAKLNIQEPDPSQWDIDVIYWQGE